MKDLEALKKRLPTGIDIRLTSKKVVKFRARFRKLGFPEVVRTFPDLQCAKHWLAEQERNALIGEFLPPANRKERQTFAQAVERYRREELPKKGNDARNRAHHLDWFSSKLGPLPLQSIRTSNIKEALHLLENEVGANGKRREAATIVRYLASLSHLFTIAWREWEWIAENPVRKITRPTVSNCRQRYLFPAEIDRLFLAVKESKSPVLLPIVALALITGMRLSEIMHLRCRDIHTEEGFIHLKRSKNGEPRFIPLRGYALQLLHQYLQIQNPSPEQLVFPSPNKPNKPYDIRSAWRCALKRATIDDFRLHDLRHTTASYHRMNGIGLHDIGLLLGHRDARSTARYAHLSTDYKTKLVDDLDQTLFGGK